MDRLVRTVVLCALLHACSKGVSEDSEQETEGLSADASVGDGGAPDAAQDAGELDNPCGIDSGWDGDEYCLVAPAEDEGFQLHFGPADYDDEEDVAKYVLQPGSEALLCAYINTPNDAEIHYADWLNSLRPGSHHMVVTLAGMSVTEASGVPCEQGGGVDSGGIVGGNTTSVAPLEDIAPENEGLARLIPAHAGVAMQLHFFNTSDKPLLMEAWQNIYYMDPDDVKGLSSPLEGFAGLNMSIEPGTREVIKGQLVAPEPLRVIDLYSHNHDHTERFTVYLRRKGADDRTLIYESYDWEHPMFLPLDTVHDNEEPNRERLRAGGMTGMLELDPGDALEFECEINNNDLDIPLRFANKAHEGEMCIMRGNYAPSFGRAWSAFNF